MKCLEMQELLVMYWDLEADDPKRVEADEHIATCDSCREEFEIWQESASLIQSTAEFPEPERELPKLSSKVMDQIYAIESWRQPVVERAYQINFRFKRNLLGLVAFCMALFVTSFVFSVNETADQGHEITYLDSSGVKPVAIASDQNDLAWGDMMDGAVASAVSDPLMLEAAPIPSSPEYYVALSLFGLICALLILNWLSRLRV